MYNINLYLVYTHHQKFVLVDSETENSDDRHLVAFLGGIDLAKGRYEVGVSITRMITSINSRDVGTLGC